MTTSLPDAAKHPAPPRRRAARDAVLILLAAAAGASAAYATGVFTPSAQSAAAPHIATALATVGYGDVAQIQQTAATLGYDGAYVLLGQLPGIVTWLPPAGSVITPGQRLYDVNGAQVILLRGAIPAWRAFTAAMSDGPDVKQLQQDLRDLGFDPYHAMNIDGRYSWATAAAVDRLLAAHGVPAAQRTGALALGNVLFLPEAIRVTSSAVSPGALVAPGTAILAATTTRRAVLMQLSVDQQNAVSAGDPVRVVLPDGDTVGGHVSAAGHVATAPSAQAGDQGADAATVSVTVTLDGALPAADAALDQAPVQVGIVTASHSHVLTAPITALLAGPGGTYQVRIVVHGARTLVTVSTGLFDDADGTVEISGLGIGEDTQVEVPAA